MASNLRIEEVNILGKVVKKKVAKRKIKARAAEGRCKPARDSPTNLCPPIGSSGVLVRASFRHYRLSRLLSHGECWLLSYLYAKNDECHAQRQDRAEPGKIKTRKFAVEIGMKHEMRRTGWILPVSISGQAHGAGADPDGR